MSDFLVKMHAELLAAENNRDRAQQTEAGASQTEGCRAELVMLASGVPESDPRLGWQAWMGNAAHERLAALLAGEGRVLETKFYYRGVPCTIDRYDVDDTSVTDYKSKGTAGDIATVRRDGPNRRNVKQVMLGAAGVREAGHNVTTVRLVYFPREGDLLKDSYVWEAPFDQALADEAAEWHEKVRALIAERHDLPVEAMVDGLRDQPPSWCWTYCTRVTACRGERPVTPPLDEAVADIAAEYLEAKSLEEEAKARISKARVYLEPYEDLSTVGLQWTGGNPLKGEEIDMDAIRFLIGDDLPMRPKQGTSSRSLRRVK